ELVDLITIDITFASLRSVLPNIIHLLKKKGEIIALIKPIFEMEFHDLERFEIILDPDVLIELLENLIEWCLNNRIYLKNIMKSPLLGKGGSVEFLAYFKLNENAKIDYMSKMKDII
ncbi:MAG: SAM-dependent methyltransferase, partial [Candidatus Hermodarchaeota archaeon]